MQRKSKKFFRMKSIRQIAADVGVYVIENTINGKMYVGSSKNIKLRFISHLNLLNSGKHHSEKLQRAWVKYGESSFKFKRIIFCSFENLFFYEQLAIDSFDSHKNGYNILPKAGTNKGFVWNNKSREKLSSTKNKMRPKIAISIKTKTGKSCLFGAVEDKGKWRLKINRTITKRYITISELFSFARKWAVDNV